MSAPVTDRRPGLNPARLVELMRASIARTSLDLSGRVVLTEAASGSYIVTPVLAAMAGASSVYALARDSRYGTAAELGAATLDLAVRAGVAPRLSIVGEKTADVVGEADIVTNSGHVRPIDRRTIAWMKPNAVVSLMYEAWEFRASDVDLDACRERGIVVAGVNERHPAVDVFSYLGIMAVRLLLDAGVAVYGSRVLVLCDNPFAPFIERGLRSSGADVEVRASLAGAEPPFDAVVVALQPGDAPVLDAEAALILSRNFPGAVVVQYWGDLDRAACERAGIPVWPPADPGRGHMGVLPSAVGPEPIVRLQTGGLKVGEVLAGTPRGADYLERVVASGYVQLLGEAK
jgi:hypothetical protein